MKKSALFSILGVVALIAVGIFLFTKKMGNNGPAVTDTTELDLPLNTLPLVERPFITLSPDGTGRSLNLFVLGAPQEGELEYEMVYQASGKQEGVLGSIFLASEKQPIVKSILLGSKSGGGKVTYHEGVTGGSLTITYGQTRLKESWNYLTFDPSDPIVSSTDGRFQIILPKTALKKDTKIITMKTFGLPAEASAKEGYPGKVLAGPYGYFTASPVKATVVVEIKLPVGDHLNPTIYEYNGTAWKKLVTKLAGDAVSASATSNVFVVTAE